MSPQLFWRPARTLLAAGVMSLLLVSPGGRGADNRDAAHRTSGDGQNQGAKSCKPSSSVTVQSEADRAAENMWTVVVRNAGPSIASVVSVATGIDLEMASPLVVWEGALQAGEERVLRLEYAPSPGGDCVVAMIESGVAPDLVLRHAAAAELRRGVDPKQRRRYEVTMANGEQIIQFIGSQEVER